ncbi:MAG TPA: hypothetical protein VI821_00640 [Candidatus Paceibacterota bacterium]
MDYIKCPSCNYPIGTLTLAFREAVKEMLKSHYGDAKVVNDPDTLRFIDSKLNCIKIYEALGVERVCCRMRLLTSVDFVSAIQPQ